MKDWFYFSVVVIISILTNFNAVSSFWTNPFGGETNNDISNTGIDAAICPKWATYFEVDNTTTDCRAPKLNSNTPFRVRGDIFCGRICEEVNLTTFTYHALLKIIFHLDSD